MIIKFTNRRLSFEFYKRDVLAVAPDLLGKHIVLLSGKNQTVCYRITETEAYRGEDDLACHASKGKTNRNLVMYEEGGLLYVYLIYGMYWMLNIVTGQRGSPQAVLIRGIDNIAGPGKVSKTLQIDKSFYGEKLLISRRIWIEDHAEKVKYKTAPRVGIDYAGEYWKNRPWRYILDDERQP